MVNRFAEGIFLRFLFHKVSWNERDDDLWRGFLTCTKESRDRWETWCVRVCNLSNLSISSLPTSTDSCDSVRASHKSVMMEVALWLRVSSFRTTSDDVALFLDGRGDWRDFCWQIAFECESTDGRRSGCCSCRLHQGLWRTDNVRTSGPRMSPRTPPSFLHQCFQSYWRQELISRARVRAEIKFDFLKFEQAKCSQRGCELAHFRLKTKAAQDVKVFLDLCMTWVENGHHLLLSDVVGPLVMMPASTRSSVRRFRRPWCTKMTRFLFLFRRIFDFLILECPKPVAESVVLMARYGRDED